jgi:predicted secreted protein
MNGKHAPDPAYRNLKWERINRVSAILSAIILGIFYLIVMILIIRSG